MERECPTSRPTPHLVWPDRIRRAALPSLSRGDPWAGLGRDPGRRHRQVAFLLAVSGPSPVQEPLLGHVPPLRILFPPGAGGTRPPFRNCRDLAITDHRIRSAFTTPALPDEGIHHLAAPLYSRGHRCNDSSPTPPSDRTRGVAFRAPRRSRSRRAPFGPSRGRLSRRAVQGPPARRGGSGHGHRGHHSTVLAATDRLTRH